MKRVLLILCCALVGVVILSGVSAARTRRGGTDGGGFGAQGSDSGENAGGDGNAGGDHGPSGPVTPAGWRIAPAGLVFGVSRLAVGFQGPLGEALSPDNNHLLTSSDGAARMDSVDLWNLSEGARTSYQRYDADAGQSAFYGIVFSPDGTRAWASGGGQNVVHEYVVRANSLFPIRDIPTPYFPTGLAYLKRPAASGGDRIYVANNLAITAGTPPPGSSGSDSAGNGGNAPGNRVSVIDPATGAVHPIALRRPLEPYGVAFDRTGSRAYVTEWMGRSVAVIDTRTEQQIADIQLSPPDNPLIADHPNAIAANPRRDEVYVANGNSDTVSVINTRTNAVRTIDVSLVRSGPRGAKPSGLAVAPDGRRLYVTLSGENAVAVVDLDSRSVAGFIPTDWFPVDVKVTSDGSRLIVLNKNDSGAGPNPCGPKSPKQGSPYCNAHYPPDYANRDERPPGRASVDPQYTGSMIKGSIQVIDAPRNPGELRRLTEEVERNNDVAARRHREPNSAHRIKHIIYVIKENRTYDQVFGSLGRGNGDPSLTLFGDESAPNHRQLARRFVTIDNFYADSLVSADGHNWITEATASDYVDNTWPVNYSPSPRSSQRSYDFEDLTYLQQFPTEPLQHYPAIPRSPAAPTIGYLWDNAFTHRVSYRDYGEFTQIPGDCITFTQNLSHTTHLDTQRYGGRYVDTRYPGYNLGCSDHAQREPEWEREFNAYVQNGNLPQLTFLRLPNDHTRGTTPGAATPRAYVADNDLALGEVVQRVSHSRYWNDTLILVTEDDAQDGPDHVDAHRTVALAISPYTQTGRVDSTHYDTSSMVATIEDLLGLPPMSITDSRVHRMWGSFTNRPNFAPYDALTPAVAPYDASSCPATQASCAYERNPATAPMAADSAHWNFSQPDAAPECNLNLAIWRSVKGRKSRMPNPRHRTVGYQPNDNCHDM